MRRWRQHAYYSVGTSVEAGPAEATAELGPAELAELGRCDWLRGRFLESSDAGGPAVPVASGTVMLRSAAPAYLAEIGIAVDCQSG